MYQKIQHGRYLCFGRTHRCRLGNSWLVSVFGVGCQAEDVQRGCAKKSNQNKEHRPLGDLGVIHGVTEE